MIIQGEENVSQNLRNQLAVAVRSIHWSYAIFWAFSTTQQGVLEWCEGYYNGDIKTRKTVESKNMDGHRRGLQRSEQLRKLYESLLEGESEVGTRKSSGALSPDDLSNLEWYYLVSMSFTFKLGQSLPGRAFATGQHIWLCNAQSADSRVFSRSLLAKSASVQTLVCFPHMGGVIELGVTDLVLEDSYLIQHIKTTLLEVANPISSKEHSNLSPHTDHNEDHIGVKVTKKDLRTVDTHTKPCEEATKSDKEIQDDSPDDCSIDCCHHVDELLMLDGTSSPFLNWDLLDHDDDLSQSLQKSPTFHGCSSQEFDNGENTGDQLHFTTLGLRTCNDNHYTRTLSTILDQNRVVKDQNFKSVCGHTSNFMHWKEEFTADNPSKRVSQRILKMILFRVPLMHTYSTSGNLKEDQKKSSPLKPQACDLHMLHPTTLEERTCNELVSISDKTGQDEQHLVLGSIVPSITMMDGTSSPIDTIECVEELEAKVIELESCIEMEEERTMKDLDISEQTSDNYERDIRDCKKPWINKRKASEIDAPNPDSSKAIEVDIQPLDMEVTIVENEVLVEIKCPWRDFLLLDIMEAVNNLNLDTHTIHSSTLQGILSLSLKSKFQGGAPVSEAMIKQALERNIGIC